VHGIHHYTSRQLVWSCMQRTLPQERFTSELLCCASEILSWSDFECFLNVIEETMVCVVSRAVWPLLQFQYLTWKVIYWLRGRVRVSF